MYSAANAPGLESCASHAASVQRACTGRSSHSSKLRCSTSSPAHDAAMRPSCNATCHGDSSSSSSNFFAVGSRKECSLSLRRWQRNHISCHAMTCMCKCMLGVSVRPLGRGALSVQHACQQARMCVRTHPLALAQLSCLIQLLYATNQRLKVRKEGGWAVLCQVQQNLWGAIGVGNSLAAGEVTEQGPDAEQQVGSGGQLARASCNQGTHNTVLLMCVCAQSTTKHAHQGAHMHTHTRTHLGHADPRHCLLLPTSVHTCRGRQLSALLQRYDSHAVKRRCNQRHQQLRAQ